MCSSPTPTKGRCTVSPWTRIPLSSSSPRTRSDSRTRMASRCPATTVPSMLRSSKVSRALTSAPGRLSVCPPPRTGGSAAAIDGLYWYRGSLIGVQHLPGLEQVTRYDLAPDGRSIRHIDVLERADSLLRLPTTGAIVGTHFYYIADSQFDRLGDDNHLAPPSRSPAPLSTVRVLTLPHH